MVTTLPYAADEYDEGLQRAPELESSMVATAVWQVHPNSSCRTYSSSNKQSKYHTKQATSKANRDDDCQSTDEAGAVTAAAAAVVVAVRGALRTCRK